MESEKPEENRRKKDRFHSISFLFRLAGIPLKLKKVSIIYAIYMVTMIICSYTTFVGILADVFVHYGDLGHAAKNMGLLFPMSSNLWIYIYCRLRQQSIERAVNLADRFTWEDLPIRDADTGHLTAAGWIPRINFLSTSAAMASLAFYGVQSTLSIFKDHETIFSAWYPFDCTISPFYELVNISQGIAVILHAALTFGFLSLDTWLISVACTQFDKLIAAILDIRQEEVRPQTLQDNEDDHNISNCSLHTKLNRCIQHHQKIMALMQEMEGALNMGLCGHFLILLATMCFAAFSIVTNWGDYANMILAVLIYIVFSSDVLLICWFGTQLTQRAESVRDAAFGCDWVGTPVPFQRCLMFIIAAANREFHLTAGKFVPVSNATFLNIMQETMSFFMFLLHVRDKNEETNQRA